MNINIKKIIFYLIALRPIISFSTGYIDILGVISLAILDFLIIIYLISEKFKPKTWFTITITILLFIIGLIQSRNYSIVLRDGSKFITIIMIMNLCTEDKFLTLFKEFTKNKVNLIKNQIIIIYGILFIQTLDTSKYKFMYDEKMFTGNLSHSHTLAYLVLLILIIISSIKEIQKQYKFTYYIVIIESLYLLLLSSARLALICGIFIILFFNKDLILALIGTLIGFVYVNMKGIESITFFSKFVKSKEQGSISSGRNILWNIDIEYFKNSRFINKVIGNGIDFPYQLHLKEYGDAIWSHNDFFNILIVNGIIGLMMYIYTLVNYIRTITKNRSLIDKVILCTLLILIAFGNGLYSYTDFIIALVFIALDYRYNARSFDLINIKEK